MKTLSSLLVFLVAAGAAAQTALPHPDHIVIVIEENKGFSDVIGSSKATFINSLAKNGASLTNYHGLHHPSQPNYLELFAGFPENLPSDLSMCTSDEYARKHCPRLDFTGIDPSLSFDTTKFPTTAAGFKKLPDVSIVIPNLLDDMHSTEGQTHGHNVPREVHQGDAWLKTHIGPYAKWAMTHNSLLIVTWDEDSATYPYPNDCSQAIDTPSAQYPNHIPTIIVGRPVKPGKSDTEYTHYDLLRTLEDIYGLTAIGGSSGAQPITGIWK